MQQMPGKQAGRWSGGGGRAHLAQLAQREVPERSVVGRLEFFIMSSLLPSSVSSWIWSSMVLLAEARSSVSSL